MRILRILLMAEVGHDGKWYDGVGEDTRMANMSLTERSTLVRTRSSALAWLDLWG